jgi:hypothetical protein
MIDSISKQELVALAKLKPKSATAVSDDSTLEHEGCIDIKEF